MSESRLGAPVELPWWIIPLGLPPVALVVAGAVVSAPLATRLLAVLSSLALLVALAVVATRIASRNIQSVWISAAYAIWTFTAIAWAVLIATA